MTKQLKLEDGGLYELFEKIVEADEETAVDGVTGLRRRQGEMPFTKLVASNEYADPRTQAYFQGFLLGIACISEGAIDLQALA